MQWKQTINAMNDTIKNGTDAKNKIKNGTKIKQ